MRALDREQITNLCSFAKNVNCSTGVCPTLVKVDHSKDNRKLHLFITPVRCVLPSPRMNRSRPNIWSDTRILVACKVRPSG
jgi:hypothetical protein